MYMHLCMYVYIYVDKYIDIYIYVYMYICICIYCGYPKCCMHDPKYIILWEDSGILVHAGHAGFSVSSVYV